MITRLDVATWVVLGVFVSLVLLSYVAGIPSSADREMVVDGQGHVASLRAVEEGGLQTPASR